MTDDREPFREARAAGLKARQERRLENATYTAAEVKVLTEAALRLGRKEALEEAATGMRLISEAPGGMTVLISKNAYLDLVNAQYATSQPSPDVPTERTEAPGYSDLPQDPQAARSPQGDTP